VNQVSPRIQFNRALSAPSHLVNRAGTVSYADETITFMMESICLTFRNRSYSNQNLIVIADIDSAIVDCFSGSIQWSNQGESWLVSRVWRPEGRLAPQIGRRGRRFCRGRSCRQWSKGAQQRLPKSSGGVSLAAKLRQRWSDRGRRRSSARVLTF
jgi:hypothetical protein